MTYKLELHPVNTVLMFGVLTLLTIAWLALVGVTIFGGPDISPFFALMFGGVLAWNWFSVLRVPYRIEVEDVSDIRFVSVTRTTHVSATAIQSLKSSGSGYFVLRFEGGKIRLFPNFTGFYEFLGEIKKANPRFETRGI